MENRALVCPICGDRLNGVSSFYNHIDSHLTEDEVNYTEVRGLVDKLADAFSDIYLFNRNNKENSIVVEFDANLESIIVTYNGHPSFKRRIALYHKPPFGEDVSISKTTRTIPKTAPKAATTKESYMENFLKEFIENGDFVKKAPEPKKNPKDFTEMSYQDFLAALKKYPEAESNPKALETAITNIAKEYGVTDEKEIDAFAERQTKNAIKETFGENSNFIIDIIDSLLEDTDNS